MTQFQFDLICKLIDSGAPILSRELCGSLDALVKGYNAIVEENEQLKAQIASMTSDDEAVAEEIAE